MKRRLDLALALVHRPRIIFLDEPTTGLDPQSRASSGTRSRGWPVTTATVFFTTQYLEEADVLADRVGIIDRGKIVAEGTPEELKAEIGRPTLEVTPPSSSDDRALAAVLGRFGERSDAVRRSGRAAEAWGGGPSRGVPPRAGQRWAHGGERAPAPRAVLDDVFLAQDGALLGR